MHPEQSTLETPNVTVVKPSLEDLSGSDEVYYKTWLATYPNEEFGVTEEDIRELFINRSKTPEDVERRRKMILNPEANTNWLIAKEGNKVIGVCFVRRYRDYDQLQSIYVLPEYHGKGVAHKLWEAQQAFLRKDKDVKVHVVTYNTRAIEFYKKLGFVDHGVRMKDDGFKLASGAHFPEMEMVLKKS